MCVDHLKLKVLCCLLLQYLKAVDEGKYVNQFYHGHIQLSKKLIVLVLDRQEKHTSTFLPHFHLLTHSLVPSFPPSLPPSLLPSLTHSLTPPPPPPPPPPHTHTRIYTHTQICDADREADIEGCIRRWRMAQSRLC